MLNPLENPLVGWSVRRLRREGSTLAGAAIFGLIFYAIVGLMTLAWAADPARRVDEILTQLHYLGWSANVFLLLLFTPARLAQRLAKEREAGTLDTLRLCGLSGLDLALGQAAQAAALPLVLAALTLPVVLLGALHGDGLEAVARAYPVLLLLGCFYSLWAGVVGLSTKKAQSAGGSAIFSLLFLLGVSGLYAVPGFGPLGILGPWGAGLGTLDDAVRFRLHLLGTRVPGEVVQLPALLGLGLTFLLALGRRLSGLPMVLMGWRGSIAFSAVVALVIGLTFHPTGLLAEGALCGALFTIFAALFLLALETPVRWRDLVRGLARRAPDDVPFAEEEVLSPARFAPGLMVLVAALLIMTPSLGASRGQLEATGLWVGGAVMFAAWVLAGLAFQAASMFTRDKGAPRLLTVVALAAIWFGPLLATWVMDEMGAPKALQELPLLLNPFYGVLSAASSADPGGGVLALEPLSAAVGCVAVQLFVSFGLWTFVRAGLERAREEAASLVALPADAYGAPGTLTQRCPQGHLYAETWAACPHCAEAAQEPPPPRSAEPPPASEEIIDLDDVDCEEIAPGRGAPQRAAGEATGVGDTTRLSDTAAELQRPAPPEREH